MSKADELRTKIATIPRDDYWWGDGHETFYKIGLELVDKKGMSVDDVIEMLSSLFDAVAEEYGE